MRDFSEVRRGGRCVRVKNSTARMSTPTHVHSDENTHTHRSRSVVYPSAYAKVPRPPNSSPGAPPPLLKSLRVLIGGNYICISLPCLFEHARC